MKHRRSAGILLHITSLPAPFGIGDLGREAFAFADFLSRSQQHYWQLLPLNPVSKSQAYSPYSALSSVAGNTMLISPEELAKEGFVSHSIVNKFKRRVDGKVDFEYAAECRHVILETSRRQSTPRARGLFEKFKAREKWLEDYALYTVLKDRFNGRPWFEWPDEFKLRNPHSIRTVLGDAVDDLEAVKWAQFIFFYQWHRLHDYCKKLNIRILGDLPFYISYDSADVWANRKLFRLDGRGAMEYVAGVPPDYFNKDGQLWGMPVFRWNTMKKENYKWWIQRIGKNLELFDEIRLDHFRAFSGYWEVASQEKTAKRGRWMKGPGSNLLDRLANAFPDMPFVAEDLGDITPDVYELRDKYRLPGMKVIQFAFGDALPASEHSPHNYAPNFFAYTGTHDNNTTIGWYRKELSRKLRHQVDSYTGKAVTEKNVHLVLSQILYASVARTVILPVQDILGLDERDRMNTPASMGANWTFRLRPGSLGNGVEKMLGQWASLYGRA